MQRFNSGVWTLSTIAWLALWLSLAPAFPQEQPPQTENPYVLAGSVNYLTDFPPVNPDGTVNAVVEIPAGTTPKWEVSKNDGRLAWDFEDGKPRVVRYLPYPGNYGMVPQTVLPKEKGGDGDPLDVIILSDTVPRGTVLKVRPVGVLKLLEKGEIDDKIICVLPDSPLGVVNNLSELEENFPGITKILETWFVNYKGRNRLQALGLADLDEARRMIQWAAESFAARKHESAK